MQADEMRRAVQALVVTAEVIGDEMRPHVAALMVEDLSVYPLPVVERALAACRRELKGRLSLAAILERIEDGHPAPNEAWALALRAADERKTVVWTTEISSAWAACRPLVDAGDRIAARMAFLEVYTRLLKDARAARRMGVCAVSLGHDPADRTAVLQQAVERGQLAHEQVAEHLQLAAPAPAFDAVALLAGRVEPSPNATDRARAHLERLRAELFPTGAHA
ncbi:hypothetical protein ABE488_09115 [Luteimonas sp. TWI662]|uniref:hypothetical protein n=1 Tax=Luteimonas sp. TWI662 TaxID=3136789 RepID=UPI0032087E78